MAWWPGTSFPLAFKGVQSPSVSWMKPYYPSATVSCNTGQVTCKYVSDAHMEPSQEPDK